MTAGKHACYSLNQMAEPAVPITSLTRARRVLEGSICMLKPPTCALHHPPPLRSVFLSCRYYIRQCAKPKARAALALAVKVCHTCGPAAAVAVAVAAAAAAAARAAAVRAEAVVATQR